MKAQKTDWDLYYSKPAKTAPAARKVTERKILNLLGLSQKPLRDAVILEMGGANSCFYSAIAENLQPKEYWIMDNNQTGLNQFKVSYPEAKNVQLMARNIMDLGSASEKRADIVFSAGLIEHFDRAGTQKAIQAHFKMVREGGLVLLTFPTPTWLYLATRRVIEWMGMWIFHDERPLEMEEVLSEVKKYGKILHESVTWPIFLTQGVIVVQVERVL